MNYELIKKFKCNGKEMVIVKTDGAAHVMDNKEWRKVFGERHPERCGNAKLNNKKTA